MSRTVRAANGNHPPNDNRDGQQQNQTATDALVKIAGTGPLWLRALALCALIVTTTTPYFQRGLDYLDERRLDGLMQTVKAPVAGPASYKGGTPVAPPKEAQQLAADTLSPSDAKHITWHTATMMEHPPFKRLAVADPQSVIAYTVYPTDGCILINHIKDHQIKSDLVRANEDVKTGLSDKQLPIEWETPRIKLNVDWEPQMNASRSTPDKTPVQGGCLNPHPGQFQFWSVPVNQCDEQVFRRFVGDGCTHYQLHNRCNNYWDPEIHWTMCNPEHRW